MSSWRRVGSCLLFLLNELSFNFCLGFLICNLFFNFLSTFKIILKLFSIFQVFPFLKNWMFFVSLHHPLRILCNMNNNFLSSVSLL